MQKTKNKGIFLSSTSITTFIFLIALFNVINFATNLALAVQEDGGCEYTGNGYLCGGEWYEGGSSGGGEGGGGTGGGLASAIGKVAATADEAIQLRRTVKDYAYGACATIPNPFKIAALPGKILELKLKVAELQARILQDGPLSLTSKFDDLVKKTDEFTFYALQTTLPGGCHKSKIDSTSKDLNDLLVFIRDEAAKDFLSSKLPQVITLAANNISSVSATLRGSVSPPAQNSAVYWFEWGENQSDLSKKTTEKTTGIVSSLSVSENISGLTVGKTYYFRVAARTEGKSKVAYGQILSFVAQSTSSQQFTLTVSKSGTGSGTVTSTPTGINCGTDCSESYASGTSVTLRATASAGSVFAGWSGDCSGTGTCTVALDSNKTVTATFNSSSGGSGGTLSYSQEHSYYGDTYYLTVSNGPASLSGTLYKRTKNTVDDNWGNWVTSSNWIQTDNQGNARKPAGSGTWTCLEADPDVAEIYIKWSNGLETNRAVHYCTVRENNSQQFTLTVSKSGTGSGTVTSTPTGINCGTDCSESYASGTSVTLRATASAGSVFAGWSGDCSGTGTCTVALDSNKTVTATFNHMSVSSGDPSVNGENQPGPSGTYTLSLKLGHFQGGSSFVEDR
ncbi:MAG: hypothetical protein KatS3mg098_269 [Candidatus Parcubacteria bacterium]|nr:MAG: hypothetical protein KatS3mg098_269 [Candidatus Parcubacteria bacterium]